MPDRQNGIAEMGKQVLRGMCMGGADVIPGVSGGTIALILGIYQRLINAISHFNMPLLKLLRQKKWGTAAKHIDLQFLIALAIGILSGILTVGQLANYLLSNESTRAPTWAAFFGMILASTWLVSRYVKVDSRQQGATAIALALCGTAIAYYLTWIPSGSAELSPGYLFLCGMLGICAMILPGISGAYILLILGVYAHLTDLLKRLPKDLLQGNLHPTDVSNVLLFCSGCAVGLLLFTKALRWLLHHHQPYTMAVMSGFMLGALRKIWPFQHDLTPNHTEFKHKHFEPMWPDSFNSEVAICIGVALAAAIVVLLADRLAMDRSKEDS